MGKRSVCHCNSTQRSARKCGTREGPPLPLGKLLRSGRREGASQPPSVVREREGGQPVEPLFLKRFFSFHLWDFPPSHVAVLGKRQRGEKIGEGRFFLSLLLHIWFLLSAEFSLQFFFSSPPFCCRTLLRIPLNLLPPPLHVSFSRVLTPPLLFRST